MKNLRSKQRGIGFVGWCSILAVAGFFFLIIVRVYPLYMEKFTVISSMKSVANQSEAEKLSTSDVRKYFLRNMEVSSNTVRFTDQTVKKLVKVITDKKTKKKYIHVAYEGRNVFLKDLSFLITFDHKVELGGSGG